MQQVYQTRNRRFNARRTIGEGESRLNRRRIASSLRLEIPIQCRCFLVWLTPCIRSYHRGGAWRLHRPKPTGTNTANDPGHDGNPKRRLARQGRKLYRRRNRPAALEPELLKGASKREGFFDVSARAGGNG